MPTSRGDVMSPKGGGGALGTPKGHVGTSKGPGRRTSLEGSKMLPFPGLVTMLPLGTFGTWGWLFPELLEVPLIHLE